MKDHKTILAFILTVASCTSTVDDNVTGQGSTTDDVDTASSSSNGETSATRGTMSDTTSDIDDSGTSGSGTTGDSETPTTTGGMGDSSSTDSDGESASSSTTGSDVAVCGDGIQEDGEGCDDGNLDPEDACSNECEPQFYTGTGASCTDAQALPCQAVGADCARLLGNQGGGALCYWPDYSDSEGDCNETAGVWTPFDAPFVEINEIFVPEPGVCISHASNLICSPADQAICDAASADSCFQPKSSSGGNTGGVSLCWWDADEAGCESTAGIWTSSDSMFAMNQPNVVPPDADGSCISQVTNLD
ncbi:MAG: hypothetical protein ACE37F_19680 [Nannocystaceae bacterium]|nr:hypothetical protein [bacterium]